MSFQNKKTFPDFALYPLLWIAIVFSFGILAGKFSPFTWQINLIICIICAVLSAFFAKQKFALALLLAAFFTAGGLTYQIENKAPAPNRLKRIYDEKQIASGDPIEIEGVLQGKPELAANGFFLLLKTEKAIYKNSETKVSGKIRLFAAVQAEQIKNEYNRLNLNYGSRISLACRLRREENFLNAGVVSSKEILDQRGIDATGIIRSPLLVEKFEDTNTFSPVAWLYERRQELIVDFKEKFNVSTAGVLIASLLGNKYFLTKQTAEVFREGGTFHILVISGLHITFIGSLTILFVRRFTKKRFWQFLIAVTFLWAFSLAVGADVPVVRATIMFTVLLFSQVVFRNGTLLNAFGACALILLVWQPNDLLTVSFQLTFVSVASIITMAFPLIEKLESIGNWSPSAETPFPPIVSVWLKRFCETLYWRENVWERELERNVWSAKLFKSPYLNEGIKKNLQKPLRYLFEGLLVSLIVQIWLLPLTVMYFHRLSLFGVLLNLWAGVVIALESFAAIFALLLAQVSNSLAFPLIKLTEVLNWLLISAPNFLAENDWASLRLPNYTGAMKAIYFLYFVPVIVLTLIINDWKPFSLRLQSKIQSPKSKLLSSPPFLRFPMLFLLLLFVTIIFHPFSAPKVDGKLHIDFLDVGQGDSALLTFPNGETMLIDGGGKTNFNKIYVQNEFGDEPELFEPDTQSIGESVVSNFLWNKGYSQIDYILATHADADHIQGLSDVARNFQIKAAIFGKMPLKDTDFAELYSILQKKKIETMQLARGDVFSIGEARIEVLYPEKGEYVQGVSENNNSVVLRVIYGARKFLLTGDVEKETEHALLEMPEFLQADLVKVAHHGSKTSSIQKFIDVTGAKIAVIPVGNNSPFGHPHREVLERWRLSGAEILQTGTRGTISISTNGEDLEVKTFLP
ncbi:MAG: ComEC/Rec2 family competence protein [Acidobacteria bacterium]|nr:ComEC/Rec2 family competence protein [Acidobacteriota bacterium]